MCIGGLTLKSLNYSWYRGRVLFISPFCWVAELIPYVLPLIGLRPSSLAHRRGEEDVGGRKSKEGRKQEGRECMEIRTEARKENKD